MTDISVGSVSVDVVPNAEKFASTLKAKLRGIKVEIPVSADTTKFRAEIDAAARDRKTTIEVDADTAGADAKIDEAARNRRSTVKVDADTSALSKLKNSMGFLPSLAVGLGPALIPVAGAVAGLGAALAAPLAAAGGGLTLGAFIAGKAVKQTEAQIKALGTMQKKIAADELAISKASTPAGKKSAMATLAADTKAYHAALKDLSPAQQKFMAAQTNLKSSFTKLISGSGSSVFSPMVTGMNLLSKIMPNLAPVIDGVAKGVNTLLKDVSGFATGPGFKSFMTAFGDNARKSIVAFGRDFENFGKGMVGVFRALSPLSGSLMTSLTNMSKSFATWGQNLSGSKGVKSFIDYIRSVGPKVWDTLKNLGGAVVTLVKALAPQGGVALDLLDGIAKFVAQAKPGTIKAIALAVSGLAIAFGKWPLAIATLASASPGFLSFLKTAGKLAAGLADAFNKLPSGLKEAAGIALGVGAVALKLRGATSLFGGKGGGGLVGGALGKAAKGVVPVYVTNPGFGAPGVPGEGQKGGLVAFLKGSATPIAAGLLNHFLDGLYKSFYLPKGNSDKNALKIANDIKLAKGLGGWSDRIGSAVPFLTTSGEGARQGVQAYDKQLAAMVKGGNLVKAIGLFNQLKDAAASQGVSLRDLKASFPQYAAAIKGASPTLAHIANAFINSGLSAKQYGRQLKTLPPAVQTKVLTPGAIQSRADIQRLQRQYNLTKPQIATIIRLLGVGAAQAAILRFGGMLDGLNGKTARTFITVTTQHMDTRLNAPNRGGGPHVATGGHITGPGTGTSDSIPAYLSNGEYVVRAAAVAKYGVKMFDRINAMHFAGGGRVGYASGGSVAPNHELAALRAELSKVTSAFHSLRSAAQQFRDSVKQSLTHDPFGNGAAGLKVQLAADRNDARAMNKALRIDRRKGLKGGLFRELAASGDLNTAQQLAAMTPAEIRQYDRLYAQRAHAVGATARYATNAAYGGREHDLAREIKHLREEIAHLKNLHKSVQQGAQDGVRQGMNDRSRNASTRRRAG